MQAMANGIPILEFKCCIGKIKYKSHAKAAKARKLLGNVAGQMVKDLEPYECCNCGNWHLGRDHYRR